MRKHLASALLFVLDATVAIAADSTATKGDVVPALQKGGYVLYLRHTQTNPDQADTDPFHLDNITAQRHLTDVGREQARTIGRSMKQLGLPVDKVLASKFYRAQETAKLLDIGEVQVVIDITEGGLVVSPNENKRRAAALRGLLSTAPPEGMNTVIVGHRPNLQDAAGKEFGDLCEGEIVVFRPLGGDEFSTVARIPFARWSEWGK
ncbi:MAG: histidine phosphatase family protein [Planctomycetia bacterium]|jgi:phosphohistidine phosphatase SixA